MSSDKVICQLCGKSFKQISSPHLRKMHNGMTMEEYKRRFPNAKVISDEVSNKRSKGATASNLRRGPLSQETKAKIAAKAKGRPGYWTGKTRSDEVKQKLSKARKGKIPWNKGVKRSQETITKIIKTKGAEDRIKLSCIKTGYTFIAKDKTKVYLICNICNNAFATHQNRFRPCEKNGKNLCPVCRQRKLDEKYKKPIIDYVTKCCKENNLTLKQIEGAKVYAHCNFCNTEFVRSRYYFKPTHPNYYKICPSCHSYQNSIKQESIDNIKQICLTNNLTYLKLINNQFVQLQCNKCNTIFQYHKQIFRPSNKRYNKDICPVCHPRETGTSNAEKQVLNFIQSIYTGTVTPNDRHVLNGKELDIYLPDLNLAIEYNGLYWHGESTHHDHKYHLLHKQQFAYSKGIRVIHILEDEWLHKEDIVKSRLQQIIGVTSTKVYARKCNIMPISSKEKDKFLEENHIMGKDVSGIRYGAYYGDELIAVMTFTKSSFVKGGKGDEWELNRFAIKKYIHSPGLASKMFKRFVSDYNPNRVISYCDRRWNAGRSYRYMGFKFVGETSPSYWYFKASECVRYHRSQFMKHKIVTEDTKDLTEWEIMQQLGYDRIWDCGTLKFGWDKR